MAFKLNFSQLPGSLLCGSCRDILAAAIRALHLVSMRIQMQEHTRVAQRPSNAVTGDFGFMHFQYFKRLHRM